MRNVVQINSRKIKSAAANRGLTARAIARKAGGISHAAVSGIINGATIEPGAIKLKKVCDVIGLPIEEVFTTAGRKVA
jgi:transcriptional regulator with XRE-family HTH domain